MAQIEKIESPSPEFFEFNCKQTHSSQHFEKILPAIEDYIKYLREPAEGDKDFGKADCFNIASVHRIVNSNVARVKSLTWRENKRMFTLSFSNVQDIKRNFAVYNEYFEGVSAYIAYQLNDTASFSDTITLLVKDYIDFGFCYAFVKRDSAHPLGLSLMHCNVQNVHFNLGENKEPCEFYIEQPFVEDIAFSSSGASVGTVKGIVHVRKVKSKWKSSFHKLNTSATHVAHPNQQQLPKYNTIASFEFDSDDCPVLFARYCPNANNPLGIGVGISCLGLVKELHNSEQLKKSITLCNSTPWFFMRTGVWKNEEKSTSQPSFGEQQACAIGGDLDAKTQEQSNPLDPSNVIQNMYSKMLSPDSRGWSVSSMTPDVYSSAGINVAFTSENNTPIDHQVMMVKTDISTQFLNEFIFDARVEIERAFDQNATFREGQSRMSVSEVNDRQALDELTSSDLMNPIINKIISKYLKTIVRKNAKTLFNPDITKPNSELALFMTYPSTYNNSFNDKILSYTTSKSGIVFIWNTKDEQEKRAIALSNIQNAIGILGAVAQLKQASPELDVQSVVEDIQKETNIQIAQQQQQQQLPDWRTIAEEASASGSTPDVGSSF